MNYLSICSGIEAASVAWHPLGWKPVAFAEIEPFPSAVLAHHWPAVPNLGDLTAFESWPEELLAQADIVAGGTPCQGFSLAGLRGSLSDARGNLTLVYAQLIDHLDRIRARHGRPPVICVWENVPGVLNTDDNAFGCFLAALAGEDDPLQPPGGRWTDAGYVRGPSRAIAWRCFDAQYFGVAQRRERVFALASAGAFRPEEVLFELEGVRRDSPPSREAREGVAASAEGRSHWSGGPHPALSQSHSTGGIGMSNQELFSQQGAGLIPEVAGTLGATHGNVRADDSWKGNLLPELAPAVTAKWAKGSGGPSGGPSGDECQNLVACQEVTHALTGEGFDASEDGTGRGTPLVPIAFAFDCEQGGDTQQGYTEEAAPPLRGKSGRTCVGFSCKDHGADASNDLAPTLRSMGHDGSHANGGGQLAIAFDTTQITSPTNRCNPQPSDPCHPVTAQGHAPAVVFPIQECNVSRANLKGTGTGIGGEHDPMFTLQAAQPHGVAYLQEALPPNSKSIESGNASTKEADAIATLRNLQQEIGEEAFAQWGLGILVSLHPEEVLRSILHGAGIRFSPCSNGWLGGIASASKGDRVARILQSVRQAQGERRSPQGRKLSKQLAGQLGTYLSELSQQGAPEKRFVLHLWEADEGIGILRQALSTIQEMGRPAGGEAQPAYSSFAVRRLTPEECESLQGFPRGHTRIPWRGKSPEDCPDGPRYKACGNSWATPVARWIGERIQSHITTP